MALTAEEMEELRAILALEAGIEPSPEPTGPSTSTGWSGNDEMQELAQLEPEGLSRVAPAPPDHGRPTSPTSEHDPTGRSDLEKYASLFMHGASFGLRDELKGFGDALWKKVTGEPGTFGENYDKYRARYNASLKNTRDDLGIPGIVAEGVGMLPAGLAGGAALIGGKAINAAGIAPAWAGRVGRGIAGGGAEGLAYGMAEGDGGLGKRAAGALPEAGVGAAVGGVIPALSPAVRAGLGALSVSNAARKGGVPREAAEALQTNLRSDEAMGYGIPDKLPAATATNADLGPTMRAALSESVQEGGDLGRDVHKRYSERANAVNENIGRALDDTLGTPQGAKVIERKIHGRSDARDAAFGSGQGGESLGPLYDAAYSKPIPYDSTVPGSIEIEKLVKEQVPPQALRDANALMRLEGAKSKQISINEAGEITELPDVRQLDYMTRALREMAEKEKSANQGRQTSFGRLYAGLAKNIRDNLKEIVPEYGQALKAAAHEQQARAAQEIGQKFQKLDSDSFAEELRGLEGMELEFAKQGIRNAIETSAAKARKSFGGIPGRSGFVSRAEQYDPEDIKLLREMSSRQARQNVEQVVGKDEATRLFNVLDDARDILQQREAILANVRKVARDARGKEVGLREQGVGAKLERGEVAGALATAGKTLIGEGPRYQQQGTDALDRALLEVLQRPADPKGMRALRDAGKGFRKMVPKGAIDKEAASSAPVRMEAANLLGWLFDKHATQAGMGAALPASQRDYY